MGKLLRSGHRSRRLLGAVVALFAIGLVAPAAGAGVDDYDWAPPRSEGDVVFVDFPQLGPIGHSGPIPPQAFELFADCPDQVEHDISSAGFCIVLRIYDGTLKIGSTVAEIDPFEVVVAAMTDADGNAVIVEGEGDGGPASVPLPGGILGVPELDPLLAADPLNLLSVSATPEMGEVSIVGDNPAGFLFWASGESGGQQVLSVPLTIGLDNLLLGEDCEIGPIDINLTNGPSGDDGLAGHDGEPRQAAWYEDPTPELFGDVGRQFNTGMRLESQLVDYDFTVPGAAACGPLGLGKALDEADLNVINSVVDSVAGLPAGSGTNAISFTVDTAVSVYNSVGVGANSWFQESLAGQG